MYIIQALMSLHQNNLFFIHDKCCLVSLWPPASEIGMLLITTFVELRVVAGRSQMQAGSPQPWPWEERQGQSMAWARHRHGIASVNQTQLYCVNQMGKMHSKPLVARHAMCELVFSVRNSWLSRTILYWFSVIMVNSIYMFESEIMTTKSQT